VRSAQFDVSVFAPAGTFPLGDVPIGILVQDPRTGSMLSDAEVSLALVEEAAVVRAQAGESDNKLLHGCVVEVRYPGDAELQVSVHTPTANEIFTVPVTASAVQPNEWDKWPYYTIAGTALVFGFIYVWRSSLRNPAMTKASRRTQTQR
jgi:hypothetical protein